MKYYENGSINPLSCGCVMIPSENKYTHYVHPECKFDNGKLTTISGYEYRPWYELPKQYQDTYKHNIFTNEF